MLFAHLFGRCNGDLGLSLLQTAAKNGRTALHEAAESGNTEIVQLLLSHGARPQARDNVSLCQFKCEEQKPCTTLSIQATTAQSG